METVFGRCAGLDVHKAQVTACVRVPRAGGGREQQLAEFSTTVVGLVALRDWLEAHRVREVAMEATGVFWKPVWAVLEDAFELTCATRGISSGSPAARPMSLTRRGWRS
jgi:transposase